MNDKHQTILALIFSVIILIEAFLFIKIEQKILGGIFLIFSLILIGFSIYATTKSDNIQPITNNNEYRHNSQITSNNIQTTSNNDKYRQNSSQQTTKISSGIYVTVLLYSAISISGIGIIFFVIFFMISAKNTENNDDEPETDDYLKHNIKALSNFQIDYLHTNSLNNVQTEYSISLYEICQSIVNDINAKDNLPRVQAVIQKINNKNTTFDKTFFSEWCKDHTDFIPAETEIIENDKFDTLFTWLTTTFEVESIESFFILVVSIYASFVEIWDQDKRFIQDLYLHINAMNDEISFDIVKYPHNIREFDKLFDYYIFDLSEPLFGGKKFKNEQYFVKVCEFLNKIWGNSMKTDYLRIINQIYRNMIIEQ